MMNWIVLLIVSIALVFVIWCFQTKNKSSKEEFVEDEAPQEETPKRKKKKTPEKVGKPADSTKPLKKQKAFKSKGEELTCKALQEVLGGKVQINIRPSFLTNPKTKRALEIDCYHEDTKIGAEYNGIQHYQYPNVFHNTQEDFEKQVERDDTKRNLCDENGIYLINIPCHVDAYKTKNGKYVPVKRTDEERYERIKAHIEQSLRYMYDN